MSPFRPDGPSPPLRCRRFAYGYALDGSGCPSYLVWPQRDGQSYTLLDTSTTDTLVLDQNFFRPLGMQHFYDSFALVSQICVRREALSLFGLREDELLPDLHITREGVLRIGLGAHQEHRVNHEARAADRTKVSAEVIQLAAYEVDPEPTKAESEGGTSDSDGSESASDSEQNDPPSSLAADAEQYELMQASYGAVGKDFHDQEDLIGSEYSKLQKLELVPERWPLARLSFSLQKCVDHLDRVLAGCCWEVQATRVNPPESLLSLHRVAKCLTMQLAVYLAKEVAAILRAVLTHETKKLYNDGTVHLLCSNYWIQPIYRRRSCSTHRPDTTRPGKGKESDPAVAWPVLQHTLGRPKSGSHQLLAPAFVTGLVVSATRIPCRYGFRPTGPQWSSNSCNRRRIAIELKILRGWTRRRLLRIFSSNGRRQGRTDVCSSRLANIEMVTG